MKNLEHHAAAVENAGAKIAAARAALSRDGQPIYAPEEMQRREASAEATFHATFRDATAAAQMEITEAEAELHALDRREADPLGALLPDDLTRANTMATFVREDAEMLPLATLADRAEGAATGSDRAAMALLVRYAARRLEAEQATPGRGYGDGTARLEAALHLLRARLFGHGDKRAALMARIEAAGQLGAHATTTQYIATRYGR